MSEKTIKGLAGDGGETVVRQLINAPTRVSISGTTAKTAAALTPGSYYVKTSVDCYVRQGVYSAITAATTDYLLTTNEEWVVRVTTTGVDDGIAAITDGGTGTLFIKAVEAV